MSIYVENFFQLILLTSFHCLQKWKIPVKSKDIATHYGYNDSLALSTDNIYHIWCKFGGEVFKTPTETKLKSFNEIFIHLYGITLKPVNGFSQFDNISILNSIIDIGAN